MTSRRLGGRQVRTANDLYQVWQEVLQIEGIRNRSLWLIFFDVDDRLCPTVMPSDDLPVVPDPAVVRAISGLLKQLRDTGVHSLALMMARPGSPHMSDMDRAWGRLLDQIDPTRRWPIHLATPDRLHVFALDDLLVA